MKASDVREEMWANVLVLGAVCLFAQVAAGQETPPDTDRDGISDIADQCPGEPGHVDSPFGMGCPCSAGGVTDSDCDGIPDTEDQNQDYGTEDYGGSNSTNDTDGDGIPDDTDPTPYGEGASGTGNGEENSGTYNDGTGGTSSGGNDDSSTGGTGTSGSWTPPIDWRQYCLDRGGTWLGLWCTYPYEVLGDCWVEWVYLEDFNPSLGPGEDLFPNVVQDECRYRRGRWFPNG